MRTGWRWAVVVLAALVMGDVILAVPVYHSRSWSIGRDEILTGWDAVIEYCLIGYPIVAGLFVLFFLMIFALFGWAERGGRS